MYIFMHTSSKVLYYILHGCLLSLKSWKLGPTPRNFEMSVSGLGNIQATDDLWNSLYNEVFKRNKHINALI